MTTPTPDTQPREEAGALANELRERTAFRYKGDCKCGNCQLVPRELVDKAAIALDRLSASPAAGGVDAVAVAWQRFHPTQKKWIDVHQEDLEHYRNEGQEVRALGVISPAPTSGSEAGGEADVEDDFLAWAHDTLREINPSNYDHDDACDLNRASVEVILAIAARRRALAACRPHSMAGTVTLGRAYAQMALSVIDKAMGDTDPASDTPALLACQALSAALATPAPSPAGGDAVRKQIKRLRELANDETYKEAYRLGLLHAADAMGLAADIDAEDGPSPAGGVREAQIEAGARAIRQARVAGITPPDEGTDYDRKLAGACLRAALSPATAARGGTTEDER